VGDEVHHAHVALIPRYKDDGHGEFLNTSIKIDLSPEEMKTIAKSIADNLG
jgi:diadenosine tetraphosphate (Ap4A) HIT family hydrolase